MAFWTLAVWPLHPSSVLSLEPGAGRFLKLVLWDRVGIQCSVSSLGPAAVPSTGLVGHCGGLGIAEPQHLANALLPSRAPHH